MDKNWSADLGFGKNGWDGGSVGANAAMGSVFSADVSLVHADAVVCEAHPVGHGGAEKLAASWDFVFSRVGVSVDDSAAGVQNFAVEVGTFVFDFFGNAESSGGSFVS